MFVVMKMKASSRKGIIYVESIVFITFAGFTDIISIHFTLVLVLKPLKKNIYISRLLLVIQHMEFFQIKVLHDAESSLEIILISTYMGFTVIALFVTVLFLKPSTKVINS